MTINHVLVGVDGSAAGEAALHFAARVSEGAGAALTAVTAVDPPSSELSPEFRDQFEAERRAELPDTTVPTSVAVSGPGRHVMRQGEPLDVIRDVADAIDADLIVVGRTGLKSTPGLFHISSLPEQLAHHTTRPLAVIPTSSASLEQVVVGVTPTRTSQHALAWAMHLAEALRLPIQALIVRQPPAATKPMSELDRREASDEIASWVEPFRAVGKQITTRLIVSHNEREGLVAALTADSPVNVVGLGERGAITQVRAGGAGMHLLHRCPQPIILVPLESDRGEPVPHTGGTSDSWV